MKNSSKNRRHQTAYEAPEVEGEFLNESADTMLSVSDSLGNLSSTSIHEVDSSLLEEFNEDQGALRSRPLETSTRATKRVGASRSSGTYVSARALLDQKKAKASKLAREGLTFAEPIAEDISARLQKIYRGAVSQRGKLKEVWKSKPYLLALGAVVVGLALAKVIAPANQQRR